MNTMKNVLQFVRSASMTATIQGHGSKADFLADRIVQASTQDGLLAFSERLAKLLGSEIGDIPASTVRNMVIAGSASNSGAILSWLRKYPKVAAAICFLPQEDFVVTISEIVPEVEIDDVGDYAITRPNFQYTITCELTAPLSHGADTKAGNATLFRRQMVCGVNGGIMNLPFYAGNALRGMLRDIMADELTMLLGLNVSRATPAWNLWFFHALYAGGALEDSKQTKAAAKKLGDHGAIRADGIREFREMLPSLSLLGCAIGNRIICGRIRVGDLRPRCKEWGTGEAPVQTLFDWLYLTRRDDHEGRTAEDAHKGMIANTEVLRPGVVLQGGIDEDGHASELERAALIHALTVFSKRGYLGADSRRGFGQCVAEISTPECAISWAEWVRENKEKILKYLKDINALAVMGDDLFTTDTGKEAEQCTL